MTTRGKVITANRLTDGVTVYLDGAANWRPTLADALLVNDAAEQERLMKLAEREVAQRAIVDPYLMDAESGEDGPRPVSQRERIRAGGPTIQYVFS